MSSRVRGAKKSFGHERDILNFRPDIDFVEPEQVPGEQAGPTEVPTADEIDARLDTVIASYRAVQELADIVQSRIDERARGFVVHLDAKHDQAAIEALSRLFPDKEDPASISFEEYRQALGIITEHSQKKTPVITAADIQRVGRDETRTSFGGLGLPDGLNRPELDPNSQIVEPLDLEQFKTDMLAQLFQQLKPKISDLIKELTPGL